MFSAQTSSASPCDPQVMLPPGRLASSSSIVGIATILQVITLTVKPSNRAHGEFRDYAVGESVVNPLTGVDPASESFLGELQFAAVDATKDRLPRAWLVLCRAWHYISMPSFLTAD
jgi:hypothetical protein